MIHDHNSHKQPQGRQSFGDFHIFWRGHQVATGVIMCDYDFTRVHGAGKAEDIPGMKEALIHGPTEILVHTQHGIIGCESQGPKFLDIARHMLRKKKIRVTAAVDFHNLIHPETIMPGMGGVEFFKVLDSTEDRTLSDLRLDRPLNSIYH